MSAAISSDVYTDPKGLAQLRQQVRAEGDQASPETLRKVAGQFEALFVQQLLKTVRDSSLSEGLMDNEQSKFYQGMFDQQISLEMTSGKGLGLADMLVRQLGGNTAADAAEQPTREAVDPFAGPAIAARRPPSPAYEQARAAAAAAASAPFAGAAQSERTTAPLDTPRREWKPNNQAEFVNELWPHAQAAAEKLGVDPKILLAQAALETGWGQHIMQRRDGSSSHNLFGIKADSRWSGEQVSHRTVEFRHGVLQREQASFRAYESPGRSLTDYADFIRNNPRYEDAVGSADPRRYVTELQRAGYATDPSYARKIMNIYNSDAFQYAVSTAQIEQRQAATHVRDESVRDVQPNTSSTPVDVSALFVGEG